MKNIFVSQLLYCEPGRPLRTNEDQRESLKARESPWEPVKTTEKQATANHREPVKTTENIIIPWSI